MVCKKILSVLNSPRLGPSPSPKWSRSQGKLLNSDVHEWQKKMHEYGGYQAV
jgi:hypothetical protein